MVVNTAVPLALCRHVILYGSHYPQVQGIIGWHSTD